MQDNLRAAASPQDCVATRLRRPIWTTLAEIDFGPKRGMVQTRVARTLAGGPLCFSISYFALHAD